MRPIFLAVVSQYPRLEIHSTAGDALCLSRADYPGAERKSALVVIGQNRANPALFEVAAAHALCRLLDEGFSVTLLDFEDMEGGPHNVSRTPFGVRVAEALGRTDHLKYLLFLTHSRLALNLSDAGNDLVSRGVRDVGPLPDNTRSALIEDLWLPPTAAQDGTIDVFGCLCRAEATWPADLAQRLGWTVRTVYPGYGIYFPSGSEFPKSAIPCFRFLAPTGYEPRGWAVWRPDAKEPLRVMEPGAPAALQPTFTPLLEDLLIKVSRRLEPLRDLRSQFKRRRAGRRLSGSSIAISRPN
jgi:hypothetical protein